MRAHVCVLVLPGAHRCCALGCALCCTDRQYAHRQWFSQGPSQALAASPASQPQTGAYTSHHTAPTARDGGDESIMTLFGGSMQVDVPADVRPSAPSATAATREAAASRLPTNHTRPTQSGIPRARPAVSPFSQPSAGPGVRAGAAFGGGPSQTAQATSAATLAQGDSAPSGGSTSFIGARTSRTPVLPARRSNPFFRDGTAEASGNARGTATPAIKAALAQRPRAAAGTTRRTPAKRRATPATGKSVSKRRRGAAATPHNPLPGTT